MVINSVFYQFGVLSIRCSINSLCYQFGVLSIRLLSIRLLSSFSLKVSDQFAARLSRCTLVWSLSNPSSMSPVTVIFLNLFSQLFPSRAFYQRALSISALSISALCLSALCAISALVRISALYRRFLWARTVPRIGAALPANVEKRRTPIKGVCCARVAGFTLF